MLLLVSGATTTVARHPSLGVMVGPRDGASLQTVAATGRPWAADNDCFQQLDVDAYWRLLRRLHHADRSRFLWVTVPDVVADAGATLDRWSEWFPQVDDLGLPAAFAGQDGIEDRADEIPWEDMRCLFIGGSTGWKLSHAAAGLVAEARRRRKWVHVGRVNTRRRVRDIAWMGADSFDGRSFSAWPDEKIPRALRWMRDVKRQPCLSWTRTGGGGPSPTPAPSPTVTSER